MRNIRIWFFVILLVAVSVQGIQGAEFSDDVYSKDKTDLWVPFSEVITMNGLLGAANYYIGDRTWAQIGTASIIENFEKGFDWDPDGFPCNMLDHPYHGSLFYMSGRSSGYTFSESILWTAFGSLQWEFFMETESPSTNDVIMTSTAGSMMGEMLIRLSAAGFQKGGFWGNVISALVSPPFWINRMIYGEGMKLHANKKNPMEGSFTAGYIFNTRELDDTSGLFLRCEAEYNNMAENSGSVPFELFDVYLEAVKGTDGDIQKRMDSTAVIYGSRKMRECGFSYTGLYGSYMFRENFDHDKLSFAGLGAGTTSSDENWKLRGALYLVFGGASARHADRYGDAPYIFKGETYNFGSELENGEYYMGPGISTRLSVSYSTGSFTAETGITQLWIHSVNATDANEWGFIIPLNIQLKAGRFIAGTAYELLRRVSYYDDLPVITATRHSFRLSAGMRF